MKRGTKLVIGIALLTVFDHIATLIGLSRGYIIEINLVAAWIFNWSLIGGYAIIGIISLLMLVVLAKYINRFEWAHLPVMFIIGFKAAINYYHLYWILTVLGVL